MVSQLSLEVPDTTTDVPLTAGSVVAMDRRCAAVSEILLAQHREVQHNPDPKQQQRHLASARDVVNQMYRQAEERFVRSDQQLGEARKKVAQLKTQMECAREACDLVGGMSFHVKTAERILLRIKTLEKESKGDGESGDTKMELLALAEMHFDHAQQIQDKIDAAVSGMAESPRPSSIEEFDTTLFEAESGKSCATSLKSSMEGEDVADPKPTRIMQVGARKSVKVVHGPFPFIAACSGEMSVVDPSEGEPLASGKAAAVDTVETEMQIKELQGKLNGAQVALAKAEEDVVLLTRERDIERGAHAGTEIKVREFESKLYGAQVALAIAKEDVVESDKKLLDQATRIAELESALVAQKAKAEEKVALLERERDTHAGAELELAINLHNQADRVTELERALAAKEARTQEIVALLKRERDSHAGTELELGKQVHSQSGRIAELEHALAAQEESTLVAQAGLRRAQNNSRTHFEAVQDLRGNLRVMCRIRPQLQAPDDDVASMKTALGEESDHLQSITLPARYAGGGQRDAVESFEMERVFDGGDSAETIFKEVGQLIASAINGRKACIFAYGQTGSGKTHTMTYPWSDPDSAAPTATEQEGIIPRAVRMISDQINELGASDWVFAITGSFVEVYAEKVHDLLDDGRQVEVKFVPDTRTASGKPRNWYTPMATKVPLTTATGAFDVVVVRTMLNAATNSRRTRATAHNARSSRSHSLLTLYISGTQACPRTHQIFRQTTGALTLVDLAGSEKVTAATDGAAMKEGIDINKSLSTLRTVLGQMAEKSSRRTNMRESTLTRILEPSLAEGGRTLMFVMVSPLKKDLEETRNTLRFAMDAKRAKLGVGVGVGNDQQATMPRTSTTSTPDKKKSPTTPEIKKKGSSPTVDVAKTLSPPPPLGSRRVVSNYRQQPKSPKSPLSSST